MQEHISLTGKLPASVLGDMWGRFWNNLYKHMIPYPDKPDIDPSDEMEAQVRRKLNWAHSFLIELSIY